MLVQNKLKRDEKQTNAWNETPFDHEMSTTLLPTPPVAPATKPMPNVSLSQVQKLRQTHERIILKSAKLRDIDN